MTMYPPLQITIEAQSTIDSPSSYFKKPDFFKERAQPKSVDSNNIEPSGTRGVTWSNRVLLKRVRSHKDYTKEEMSDVWYTPEDYVEIKRGCAQTLKLMSKPDFIESDEFSARGLEIRLKQAARRRKEIKVFTVAAVLEEQELQEEARENDPERIREVYLKISGLSQSKAELTGINDQKARFYL